MKFNLRRTLLRRSEPACRKIKPRIDFDAQSFHNRLNEQAQKSSPESKTSLPFISALSLLFVKIIMKRAVSKKYDSISSLDFSFFNRCAQFPEVDCACFSLRTLVNGRLNFKIFIELTINSRADKIADNISPVACPVV